MANILIDGYNLIGIAHKNLEKARHDLILQLHGYAAAKGHRVTVVFDGWKDGEPAETRQKIGIVTVIYSGIGEKADDVIKKILSSAVGHWIAVSSDREIYAFAQKKNFVALKSDEFAGRLYATLDAGARDEGELSLKDEADRDMPPARRKGNPRKLSKKEKKKSEALKKL